VNGDTIIVNILFIVLRVRLICLSQSVVIDIFALSSFSVGAVAVATKS